MNWMPAIMREKVAVLRNARIMRGNLLSSLTDRECPLHLAMSSDPRIRVIPRERRMSNSYISRVAMPYLERI